jgi:hypothetical protein
MEHAHGFAAGGLKLVALETLVLPDGLQEFFGRNGAAVAQAVHRPALFPPDGVKVVRPKVIPASIHVAVFAVLERQSQVRLRA